MLNDLLKINCPCSFDINTIFTILFNFLAVSFGVWLSFRLERKRREKEIRNKQIEFLKLIQSEIYKNIELLKQMINVEIKNNAIPAYHLQIFTKESIWHTLVEHHFFNLVSVQLTPSCQAGTMCVIVFRNLP